MGWNHQLVNPFFFYTPNLSVNSMWVTRYTLYRAWLFVGARAICFRLSLIWWNNAPFGKLIWQWKIQDFCNYCQGRLNITLFNELMGRWYKWAYFVPKCQGNYKKNPGPWSSHYLSVCLQGEDINVVYRSFCFWKHLKDTWYLSGLVLPTPRVRFLSYLFGHLCSKN